MTTPESSRRTGNRRQLQVGATWPLFPEKWPGRQLANL